MDYLDWQDRWEKLVEKSLDKGYESLSADERIWYNVRTLIDAADNGGLISFYYNYGADHLDETVSDLKHIGSSEVIHIIEQINALFPKALPPRNIDKRNESINSWDNKNDLILESLDSQFYNLEESLELAIEPIIKRVLQFEAIS